MSDTSTPRAATAGQAFDAALVRGRTAMAEPTPVLPKIEPSNAPARAVADLRAVLSARFSHAIPAAKTSELHRSTLRALHRLEREFYWRRVRLAVSHFMMTYWVIILALLMIAALGGLAFFARETILAFVNDLIAQPLAHPSPAPGAAVPGAGGPAAAGSAP